jgi:transposase
MVLVAIFDMERRKHDRRSDRTHRAGNYLNAFERQRLQDSLNKDISDRYRQRLQIMLLADEGKTQAEICQLVGCCPGTARHWMLVARSGQSQNWQSDKLGRPKVVSDRYLARLRELVSRSPRDYGYPFRRWTAQWLSKHLAREFNIEVSDRHINRLLKQMGLSTKEANKKIANSQASDRN